MFRKSCFNTALKKDMTRFAPVWLLYMLGLLLSLLLMRGSSVPLGLPRALAGSLQPLAFVNLGYGLLTARVLFGDLFRGRLCFGLHTLPLRREGWFAAHSLAGLLFNLIPTAVVAAAAAPEVLASGAENGIFLLLSWLAAVNGQYLFFFGTAVFSMLCAGNALGGCLIYGICNFAALLAFFVVDTLYIPMLYGLVSQPEVFSQLCPVVRLLDSGLIDWVLTELPAGAWKGRFFLTENWGYLGCCAGAGLGLLLAALLLYRRRDLERSGDLLAVRRAQPVFLVLYCLLCATAFQFCHMRFLGAYTQRYFLLFAGLAVGWFTGQMLLQRSMRVFRLRSWLGLGLLALLLGTSLVLTRMDVLGLETKIPERQAVASVTVSQSRYMAPERQQTLTGDAIADVITIHQAALESRHEPGENTVVCYLEYRLKNGGTLVRRYSVQPESAEGALLRQYLSTLKAVTGYEDLVYDDVTHFALNGYELPKECWTQPEVESLFRAIGADCAAGRLAQDYRFHPYTVGEDGAPVTDSLWLTLHWGEKFLYIEIYPDSDNVMTWLQSHGLESLPIHPAGK